MTKNHHPQDKTLYQKPFSDWLTANAQAIRAIVHGNRWSFAPATYARQFLAQKVWADLDAFGMVEPSAAAERSAVTTFLRYGQLPAPAPAELIKRAHGSKLLHPEGQRLRGKMECKSLLIQAPETTLVRLWGLWHRSGTGQSFQTFLRHAVSDALTLARWSGYFSYVSPQRIKPAVRLEPLILMTRAGENPQQLGSTGFKWKSLLAVLRRSGPDANAVMTELIHWWMEMVADGTAALLWNEHRHVFTNKCHHRATVGLYRISV